MQARRLPFATMLCATALAQACPRPVPPAAGFPIQLDAIVPYSYSDGYQGFGSLLRPAVAAPTCGWPLVVFVHPLGQSRADELALQMEIASQGYAVWSYDVRAHGQALTQNTTHPNAASTLWGPVERCDLAESILFAAGNPAWTGNVDGTRVAVMGASQGAVHGWNAAAWSGRPLAVPGRAPLTFPLIACAICNDYVAEPVLDWLRDSRLWSSWFVEALCGSYPVPMDAAFLQTARSAFLAQDPAALLAYFATEGRGIEANLLTSTVPVLYSHAYHDLIDSPLLTLRLMQNMTAERRAMLSTIGHTAIPNVHERAFRDGVSFRWLHRWLWAEQNEVDIEAPFVLSELPLPRLVREDVTYPWSRHHGGDPLQAAAPTRFYLHDDFMLRETAPLPPQNHTFIDQVIDPLAVTFTPFDYLNTPGVRLLPAVLAACPLDEAVYAFTAAEERQIDASAAVHLRIVPDHADWMLAVLLTVEPPGPGAEEVMLASACLSSTTSTPGIAEDLDLVLPPVTARVPALGIVRLRLRNHWLRESPMVQALEAAPRFHDFQIAVHHGSTVPRSWLDLPMHPVRPKLSSTTTWFPLATAPPVTLSVRGGVARAGQPYFVTTGVSGHLPAMNFLNDVMPLENDWLVGIVSGAWMQPEFVNFLGSLDANGEATAIMNFSPYAPLPAVLTGLRLSFVAFVFDSMAGMSGAATNPCDVFLR